MAEGRIIDTVLKGGSQVWRRLAPSSLRGLAAPVMALLAERRVLDVLKAPEPAPKPGPLIVSGFFNESRGVSQAARLTVAGLRAAGLDPQEHDLRPVLAAGPGARLKLPFEPDGVWVIHANAPEALHALAYLDPSSWRGRYRIGYWVWELERAPASWIRTSQAFQKLWTPSRFVADALGASGARPPIQVIPHPVALEQAGHRDRARFRIPEGDLVVLSMGDLRSSLARKNLLGPIAIYRRAFPEAGSGRRLIVKVQSTDPHPVIDAAMKSATGERSDIVVMSDTLSGAETRNLIASADVFLSPHRSEGFGLPLAEAFMAGVPALATGWSGNLDFMGDIPELLIAHTLVPVRDPYGIYKAAVQRWAEPDVEDAAGKLVALAGSAALRAELAAKGRKAVEAQAAKWSREAFAERPVSKLALK